MNTKSLEPFEKNRDVLLSQRVQEILILEELQFA